MIRSSSSNRVSDTKTQSLSTSPSLPSLIYRQSSLSPSPSSSSESDLLLDNDLPTFHPNSVLGMRKKSRIRFAQSSVHVIPFLLFFCGLVLWFFSKPGMCVLHFTSQLFFFNFSGLCSFDIFIAIDICEFEVYVAMFSLICWKFMLKLVSVGNI